MMLNKGPWLEVAVLRVNPREPFSRSRLTDSERSSPKMAFCYDVTQMLPPSDGAEYAWHSWIVDNASVLYLIIVECGCRLGSTGAPKCCRKRASRGYDWVEKTEKS